MVQVQINYINIENISYIELIEKIRNALICTYCHGTFQYENRYCSSNQWSAVSAIFYDGLHSRGC